jgi:hypothetical protein
MRQRIELEFTDHFEWTTYLMAIASMIDTLPVRTAKESSTEQLQAIAIAKIYRGYLEQIRKDEKS